MAKKQLPPTDIIRQLLAYDPEAGALMWRARPVEMFEPCNGRTAENCCSVWNGKYAGTAAGTLRRYRIVKLLGQGYVAHRLIWKIVTGEEPDEIDHINQNKHDNRWCNLRNVDHSVNMRNKGLSANNTSGEKHIHWMPNIQRWTVQLVVPGKGQRQLAWCETIEEAVEVRNRLYRELGYYK